MGTMRSEDFAHDLNGMEHLQPIDVIATFKKDGGMKPLYFRVKEDGAERVTYEIDSIINEQGNSVYMDYRCNIRVCGTRLEIVICYNLKQMRWYLKKMTRDKAAGREYFSVERNKRQKGDFRFGGWNVQGGTGI